MTEFCHMHCHDAGSFFDGLPLTHELVDRAAELGQPGIAITNHGNMFTAPDLFNSCKKAGIKGVIGMEAYEAIPHSFDLERDKAIFTAAYDSAVPRYFHLTLWCLNTTGWENLCKLHSLSWAPEHKPKNQPLIDRAMLEQYNEGLAVGLGCIASRTNQALVRGGDGYEEAKWYVDVFGDRAFVECMAVLDDQVALLQPQRKLAKRLGRPTIGTNDVHYVRREDGVLGGAHHTLVQARRWKKKEGAEQSDDKSDAGYGRWYGSDGFFLKSHQEMLEAGGITPDELARTLEVLDLVDFDLLKLPNPQPPRAPLPDDGEDPDFERWLALAGT